MRPPASVAPPLGASVSRTLRATIRILAYVSLVAILLVILLLGDTPVGAGHAWNFAMALRSGGLCRIANSCGVINNDRGAPNDFGSIVRPMKMTVVRSDCPTRPQEWSRSAPSWRRRSMLTSFCCRPEQINARNRVNRSPCRMSFSYARVSRVQALKAWDGQENSAAAAHAALLHEASCNSAAGFGQCSLNMEARAA